METELPTGMETELLDALADVHDPELGLSIVELGMVYGIERRGRRVDVRMTLTTPACPLSESIADEVRERLGAVDGVDEVDVQFVWDPPWSPARMTPTARLLMGW